MSLKKISHLVEKIPQKIYKRISTKHLNAFHHCCSVCNSTVRSFDRLPDEYYEKLDQNEFIFSIFQFETLNQLHYLCPVCGASDRDRLYAIYLKKEILSNSSKKKFLDIAPSNSLRNFINKNYPDLDYRSADLDRDDVDDVLDVSEMNIYNDDTFDFLICSHVLEHVKEDKKAMQELYRVLGKNGKGIMMVPIMLSLEDDYENEAIVDTDDRWKHFGQDDHVRMYSKRGFLKKLASVGFYTESLDINFFGNEAFFKYGIHPRSVLYIVSKKPFTDHLANLN